MKTRSNSYYGRKPQFWELHDGQHSRRKDQGIAVDIIKHNEGRSLLTPYVLLFLVEGEDVIVPGQCCVMRSESVRGH